MGVGLGSYQKVELTAKTPFQVKWGTNYTIVTIGIGMRRRACDKANFPDV